MSDALIAPGAAGSAARAADYFALLKPRVMSLVVFTGLVGMVLAPGGLHPVIALTALICIAVGAGASAAINNAYDADIDARMRRTRDRPIPRGAVARADALGLGVILGVGAVLVMGLAVNLLAAGLLALTIAFYVFVYTMWLKRRTPQNIVIGGAAGALPPMIGWAAVSGDVGWASLSLFLIIFIWTPPHFWALALYRRQEYETAGVPMLPVVAGVAATTRQMLGYAIVLWPTSLLPVALGFAGPLYGTGAAVLGGLFVVAAVRVWRAAAHDLRPARQMFALSILHLFLLYAMLLAEQGLHGIR